MSLSAPSSSPLLHPGLAGLFLTVALAGGCVDLVGAGDRYIQSDEKRFLTTGTPDVVLSTFDGAIEIRSWERAEVEVIVERRASSKAALEDIEVQTQQDGNQVTVRVISHRTGSFLNVSRSARLIVSLPASANIMAKSGDGSIDLSRVSGRLNLRTGDGSIRGSDLGGDVKASSGDGSIRLEGVNGSLDIDTGDGNVAISGRLTAVRARTGDGSVSIHADEGSAATANWDVTTGDGGVTLELPPKFDAELDAHTGDGRIRVEDLERSETTNRTSNKTMRTRLGAGGGSVRVRTGDGSITVRRF